MPTTGNYLILFADLIGSTEVATEALPSVFTELYIASFQWAARQAYQFVLERGVFPGQDFTETLDAPRIQGDEVFSFTKLDDLTDPQKEDCVASAVAFAKVIKLMWLAGPYNVQRITDKQFPRGISIGLHIGPAGRVLVPAGDSEQIAGIHINIAKRIEGAAKEGSESRIFASSDVKRCFAAWVARHDSIPEHCKAVISLCEFRPCVGMSDLKGLPRKVQLFELMGMVKIAKLAQAQLHALKTTPETNDQGAETVAAKLAQAFLPPGMTPFSRDNTPMVVHSLRSAETNAGYIAKWFEAVGQPMHLFFDEAWLLMNAFFVSASLARHSDAAANAANYTSGLETLYNLLDAAVKSQESQK